VQSRGRKKIERPRQRFKAQKPVRKSLANSICEETINFEINKINKAAQAAIKMFLYLYRMKISKIIYPSKNTFEGFWEDLMKIINSTYCRPRNTARRAIKKFIKIYNLPYPKVINVERNSIIYYWDNVFKDECFFKLIMTKYAYTCSISKKIDQLQNQNMLAYIRKNKVEEVIIDMLKIWFDHQSWVKI
jgi:hypothetical protein